jgi:hypothetical protein
VIKGVEMVCPNSTISDEKIWCEVTIAQGTHMSLAIDMKDGTTYTFPHPLGTYVTVHAHVTRHGADGTLYTSPPPLGTYCIQHITMTTKIHIHSLTTHVDYMCVMFTTHTFDFPLTPRMFITSMHTTHVV